MISPNDATEVEEFIDIGKVTFISKWCIFVLSRDLVVTFVTHHAVGVSSMDAKSCNSILVLIIHLSD